MHARHKAKIPFPKQTVGFGLRNLGQEYMQTLQAHLKVKVPDFNSSLFKVDKSEGYEQDNSQGDNNSSQVFICSTCPVG